MANRFWEEWESSSKVEQGAALLVFLMFLPLFLVVDAMRRKD